MNHPAETNLERTGRAAAPAAAHPGCPKCGATHLAYDWDAVVSLRVTNGTIEGVTVGGVFGVPPDRITCLNCGEEMRLSEQPHAADIEHAVIATIDELPRPIAAALEDGFDLYPPEPR